MNDSPRTRAGVLVEAAGTLLLLTALTFEVVDHSLGSEFALSLAAAVLFLAAAPLSTEARRPWLVIISGMSLVIAVALLIRYMDAPLLNGLHLVPLTLIAFAVAIGRRSTLRRRSLDREWSQARRDGEERERRRWARELHDETLQELGAVQIVLATAAASTSTGKMKEASGQARRLIGNQITSLNQEAAELLAVEGGEPIWKSQAPPDGKTYEGLSGGRRPKTPARAATSLMVPRLILPLPLPDSVWDSEGPGSAATVASP
ncbi:histidine kinase [Actinacidiphila soli]|uniref:histidine kinase n=1 Tax=Actinacidiphila soli TaxID=2487275 RepID=UPI000FC999F4|nr:histidine kinase [Actinacidiphila soli]